MIPLTNTVMTLFALAYALSQTPGLGSAPQPAGDFVISSRSVSTSQHQLSFT